jgi:hypothetical protein
VLPLDVPHRLAVDAPTIQHQDELAAQLPVQQPEELRNLLSTDVVPVYSEVQPHPLAPRGQAERSDGREPVVPVPAVLMWRAASRRPSTAHHGPKHVPGLVHEDDVTTLLSGLFLCAASRAAASAGWPSRRAPAPAPAAPASDNSSSGATTSATRALRDSSLQHSGGSILGAVY